MLGTVSANIRISGIPAVPTLMDRVHQEHKYNKHTNISLKINTERVMYRINIQGHVQGHVHYTGLCT